VADLEPRAPFAALGALNGDVPAADDRRGSGLRRRDGDDRAAGQEQKRKQEVIRDSLQRQIATIKSVDGDRYIWPHVMDEVTKALPAYTWLVDLKPGAPAAVPGMPANIFAVASSSYHSAQPAISPAARMTAGWVASALAPVGASSELGCSEQARIAATRSAAMEDAWK
jgi:hypothetical protein